MTGYDLSRDYFDFSFENPELIKPVHGILYFFAIEHCNRLGWPKKFGLPTEMAKGAIGVRSYNTYIKALNDLVEWGFISMIEKSKNQYSSNIIALSKYDKALDKALDKAIVKAKDLPYQNLIKHVPKQGESTVQSTSESIDSINKPLNHEPLNHERGVKPKKRKRFSPPTQDEVYDYMLEKKLHPALAKKEAQKFTDFYESKNWMIGKNRMSNWKSAVSGWINRMGDFTKNENNGSKEPTINRQTADTIRSNSEGW